MLMKFRPAQLCAVATLAIAMPTYAATIADDVAAANAADASADAKADDIVVSADALTRSIENSPATMATIDATRIADTVNAATIEDVLKYLPSLLVRKRNIGDTQSPLATRTSGVGASARSLIYADGALLSALIGNNNTIASPRWGLVSPQEVERVDVLYGPYSAAYPGNAIGAVVNITTRLPEQLEGTVNALVNVQKFSQYDTRQTLPSREFGATLGDRFGPLAVFASAVHTISEAQPLIYVTALRPATTSTTGVATTGGFDDVNRLNQPIRVLGAGGIERQNRDNFKLKAALDITPDIRLTYVGGLFLNDTTSTVQTYLTSAGAPVFAGTLNIGGYAYTVAASAFSNNIYKTEQRHWSHSLSAGGRSEAFDWQIIGTMYDFDHDEQRLPTTALPGASTGGAGNVVRLDGTGWYTLDAKGVWRAGGGHAVSFGAHRDRFELASNRYGTTDWISGSDGAVNLVSRGKTRTDALWLQDAWSFTDTLTLTVGARYEWWKAYEGFNFSLVPVLSVNQPRLSSDKVSPKAALAWQASETITVTGSFGQAYRFPTVAELYQAITTGPTITVPNPNLRPERARSEELAFIYHDPHGSARVSLFNEDIIDALLSQTAPLVPGSATLFSFVQNVNHVRTRGIEIAVDRTDLLFDGFDLSGSVTLVDPRIRRDDAFLAAEGKRPPQIPTRKATLVATWRPSQEVALTAAARYSSRSFATLDNIDTVSNTYQGFHSYFVVDLRAKFRIGEHLSAAVGVDNVNNNKYFLFHPFPQRAFTFELSAKL